MSNFDYGKAEADLYDSGCPEPDEIYDYSTERGRNEFLRENGLDPRKYDKSPNSGNGSDSNVSGCFITSACVNAMGLPDNCDELQTLRAFRDSYMMTDPGMKADVIHYYEIAPAIVDAINKNTSADKIKDKWTEIYKELIEPCVKDIKENNSADAYERYREYVIKLESHYGSIY